MPPGDENADAERSADTSAAEYVAGALGGVLVLLLVAFLAYQAVAVRDTGPDLAVEITAVEEVGTSYQVHLAVTNDGGTTAEAVHLSGSVSRRGERVEEASASIAYVPPESRRDAVLVFSTDPRDGELAVGADGFRVG